MKANEAPEKIYLFENPIDNTPDYRWLSKRSGDADIEYVRTDAFIEKACSWFADRYQTNGSYLCADDIEDFENYMKGEKV